MIKKKLKTENIFLELRLIKEVAFSPHVYAYTIQLHTLITQVHHTNRTNKSNFLHIIKLKRVENLSHK